MSKIPLEAGKHEFKTVTSFPIGCFQLPGAQYRGDACSRISFQDSKYLLSIACAVTRLLCRNLLTFLVGHVDLSDNILVVLGCLS